MSETVAFDTITLEQLKVAAQVALPRSVDHITQDLVLRLRSFVLSDQGGKPVTARRVVTRKIKPRWIPKWLWNSINDEYHTVSVTATPKWIYPSADIAAPRLGQPVRIVQMTDDVAVRRFT